RRRDLSGRSPTTGRPCAGQPLPHARRRLAGGRHRHGAPRGNGRAWRRRAAIGVSLRALREHGRRLRESRRGSGANTARCRERGARRGDGGGPLMFGVGPEELVLILIIALIVLGPERMPKVARDLGPVVGELRRTSDQLREEFLNADKLLDKAADAAGPSTPMASIPATTQAPEALPAIPGETNFDREM